MILKNNLLQSRANHSMIGYNNNIYVIGGIGLNKCEKLVIENQTYRERLHQHQIDETILGEKLAEYKNVLIKINTKVIKIPWIIPAIKANITIL